MLEKGQTLEGRYTVQFSLQKGIRAEVFRVKDVAGANCFLKLLDMARLDPSDFTDGGDLLEAVLAADLAHEQLPRLIESGETVIGNKRWAWLVYPYISGESLDENLKRSLTLDCYDAINIALGVLEVLDYMHNRKMPILHNNILPENIMIDLTRGLSAVQLCGLGSARRLAQPRGKFKLNKTYPFYTSNEAINGVFTAQNDLFSVGAALYHMLYGVPPWYVDINDCQGEKQVKEAVLRERKRPLVGLSLECDHNAVTPSLLQIITTALAPDAANRYATAKDFAGALKTEQLNLGKKATSNKNEEVFTTDDEENHDKWGLVGVAGMQAIKDILVNDVLAIIKDKEGARKYGLSIPNGMLLYGPPGCGKSLIAQKFADEANYNYKFVRPSDLASIYIHGSQEMIGKLFREAREKRPSILCFDEFDDFVPRRDSINNASMSGEVNEFLTQLNNCGKSGIFVIGTTNRPDLIDIDVLRKGRFDIIIYVPPPDYEARLGLFKLYLANRPVDVVINYDELAQKTEGRVCSDIEFIVLETARAAYREKTYITQDMMLEIIRKTTSSLRDEHIARYEAIRDRMETDKPPKKKTIGFEFKGDG